MTTTTRAHCLQQLPTDRLLAEMSVWSADLTHLAADITRVDALADIYHIDVADGHFSPSMLFFPDLVAALRKVTRRPLHVHLMVADAILLEQIDQFAEAGADIISVQGENQPLEQALERIEHHGCAAGIVLQLHTPVSALTPYLSRLAFVTLLGTRMGVKGQGLADEACARLQQARRLIQDSPAQQHIFLAADGAIREHTVPELRRSGADTVVMGSLAFNAPDYAATMNWIRTLP